MYMRAFVIRFVFIGLLGVGVALGAALSQPVENSAAPQATTRTKAAAIAPAPLPVVTLSTVHVHADAARPAVRAATFPAGLTTSASSDRHGGGLAPSLRLDMPYYSFSKMLPRVGKE